MEWSGGRGEGKAIPAVTSATVSRAGPDPVPGNGHMAVSGRRGLSPPALMQPCPAGHHPVLRRTRHRTVRLLCQDVPWRPLRPCVVLALCSEGRGPSRAWESEGTGLVWSCHSGAVLAAWESTLGP